MLGPLQDRAEWAADVPCHCHAGLLGPLQREAHSIGFELNAVRKIIEHKIIPPQVPEFAAQQSRRTPVAKQASQRTAHMLPLQRQKGHKRVNQAQ
jgi:hypothetical protein